MSVTLNLTDKEAEALYWLIEKKFEDSGRENLPYVESVQNKLDTKKAEWLGSMKD